MRSCSCVLCFVAVDQMCNHPPFPPSESVLDVLVDDKMLLGRSLLLVLYELFCSNFAQVIGKGAVKGMWKLLL